MGRPTLPGRVEVQVLVRSARRCAWCHGLHGTLDVVRGQIAHIDRDPTNNDPDNLVYLCQPHHEDYDILTSQTKRYTEGELVHWRNGLDEALGRGDHKRGQVPNRVIGHDRAIFRAIAEEVASEDDLDDFLEAFVDGRSMPKGLPDVFDVVMNFALDPEHQFMDPQLDATWWAFLAAFVQLFDVFTHCYELRGSGFVQKRRLSDEHVEALVNTLALTKRTYGVLCETARERLGV